MKIKYIRGSRTVKELSCTAGKDLLFSVVKVK